MDKHNLLVIDDDKMMRDLLKTELKNHNFIVNEAPDGEEGVMSALKDHPDLILLDVIMPKLDGIGVMKKLREDEWGKNVPIILLTNQDTTDPVIKAIGEYKPSFYFIKSSMHPSEVALKIKEVLGS